MTSRLQSECALFVFFKTNTCSINPTVCKLSNPTECHKCTVEPVHSGHTVRQPPPYYSHLVQAKPHILYVHVHLFKAATSLLQPLIFVPCHGTLLAKFNGGRGRGEGRTFFTQNPDIMCWSHSQLKIIQIHSTSCLKHRGLTVLLSVVGYIS